MNYITVGLTTNENRLFDPDHLYPEGRSRKREEFSLHIQLLASSL